MNQTTRGAGWVAGEPLGEAKGVELSDGSVLFNGRTAKKIRALTIIGEGGPKSISWFPGRLAASESRKGDEKMAGNGLTATWLEPDGGPFSESRNAGQPKNATL